MKTDRPQTSELSRCLHMAQRLRFSYRLPQALSAAPPEFLRWVDPRAAEAAIFRDAAHPGEALVACRGTEGCTDWYRDFDNKMMPAGDGLPGHLYRGFNVHANYLIQALLPALREFDAVSFGFHSLAAGAGPRLIRGLHNHGVKIREAWAFGMPRMADRDWAQAFDAWTLEEEIVCRRVVAVYRGRQDLITRVPLSRNGWYHCMAPFIMCDGRFYRNSGEWEEIRRQLKVGESGRFEGWLAQWRIISRLRASVEAHSMDFYIKAAKEVMLKKQRQGVSVR